MPTVKCLETWKINVNQSVISKIFLLELIKYLKQNNNSKLQGSTKQIVSFTMA